MPGAIPDLDTLGPKVVDPHALDSLRDEMRMLLQRDKHSFPGAQPVSLLKQHFEELCNKDFFVCEKSDGIRCLMLMSTVDPQHRDFRPATYLVDRKNNYYYIPDLGFPMHEVDPRSGKIVGYIRGKYHRDTILDGEIVLDIDEDKGKQQLKFLVFDALVVDGKFLLNRNLSTRLGHANEWIHTPYKAMLNREPNFFARVPFIIEPKHMEFAYGIEDMFRIHLPNLKHGNDGLIFTSLEGEYVCGTDPYILKWKPDDENSIDFRVNLVFPPSSPHLSPYVITTQTPYSTIPSGTIFQLSVWKGGAGSGSYQTWGDMYVPASDWTKLQKSTDVETPLENAIVECRWDKKVGTEGRWRFMRFRTDKENANYVDVAKNVRQSIEDGVSKEELLSWAVGIKAGWRMRHPKKN